MLPNSKISRFAILAIAATLVIHTTAQLCDRADTPEKISMLDDARAILDGNWVSTMNSTLPSPNLYPHQWSWDASFVAIGYSHYDTRKAIDETDALFRGQWRNGAVPHIVFNPSAVESYFPGPQFWKIDTAGESGPVNSQTSGIIQPPVHAIASLAIYKNAPAQSKAMAYDHLVDIYPKLVKWHNYLYNERDPLNRGLVFIRHMWESGMDNSPAWEAALAAMRLKEGDVPPYQRVDKGKVGDHKERPSEYFYDRAVHLIKVFYDNSYDESRIFKNCPFLIEDVLFNAILARAGEALADIADILGKFEEGVAHRERADWTARAISDKLYNEEDGFFYDYDLVAKEQIRSRISGGLVGLYGAKVNQKQLKALVENLYDPGFLGKDLSSWTIPSVSKNDPGYTNSTYWKGPAWININYLVREGLIRNANGDKDALRIARYLKDRSLELMRMSGFYEYFSPISGSPHGGHKFSWSASLAIDWVCSKDEAVVDTWFTKLQNIDWRVVCIVIAGIVAILFVNLDTVSSRRTAESSTDVMEIEEDAILLKKKNISEAVTESRMRTPKVAPRLRSRSARSIDRRAV